ncbi:TonB-dependent receptor [Sphingomonas colocasiae]|uniref:TonB-dependent receptor n=1 Tax=Sphingomonas colocasiae TaxID=1848973 RepID=A0ABS7PTX9_9SPHN|nr:TonB-dependent receptor [Sphingomonas colocasiae]MBY8824800.1 TonB-dependent receptor [Sphingomonas colocasiae]
MRNGRNIQRTIAAALASAASIVVAASPGFAQTGANPGQNGAANEAPQAADEIVVTATRRAETVRDVPFNIQAISADTLEKTGATDLTDFARTVPGLSMNDYGPSGGAKLVLRGLRTGSEAGLAPTTTVYVDEVQVDMPYRGTPLDLKLLDIERVEVLRGPQGTLFGGGAIGGTLRYISKKPDTTKFEGSVGGELSTTRHGGANYNLTGMINVPVNDWIAIRANLGRFDNDGFIDNVRTGAKNVNDDRTTSGRIAVLMKPVDDLEVSLTYYRQTARYGESVLQRESQPRLTVDYIHPGITRYRAQLANLTLAYDFGWAKLTSSSSYIDEKHDSSNDGTFGIRDSIFGSFLDPDDIPEFTEYSVRRARSHAFTQEVRLVSASDGPFNWIIGGYYNKERTGENDQEFVPIPFPGQAAFEQNIIGAKINDNKEYNYAYTDRSRQYAVFGELKYQFTDAWQASVGGRYFDVRGDGEFYAIDQWFGRNARDANGLARTVPYADEFSYGSNHEKGTVWRFNTSYKLGAGLIYATIAQGFRPGGFNRLTPNTGVPPEGYQFNSDDLISYELGGKFSFAQNRIYVSSALFRIDWSDIQTTVRTPIGFSYQGNAGKAVSQGIEIELNARDILTRGLSFNLGYSYTDAKLTESIERIGFKGERMPLVPRHALSLMADYSTELSGGLKAGMNWLTSYTSGSYADFGRFQPVRGTTAGSLIPSTTVNRQYLPIAGYWLSSLSLRLEGDSWSARIFADNLFDARFKTSRSFTFANSNFATSDVTYYANRPRTIGIGLTKRF